MKRGYAGKRQGEEGQGGGGMRLEENTKWIVGEAVGGRGSYFAFFCVSSWALHPPCRYPVILLPLEAWTNARDFNALVYFTYRS